MPTNFRMKFADAKSLNFANPSKIAHTLRVISDVGTKTIKSVSAVNNRLELVSSDTATLTEGDNTVNELIACRVQLSGSVANKAAVLASWERMKTNVDAAIADGSLDGFLPRNAQFIAVA